MAPDRTLDDYSRTVSTVARDLLRSVASIGPARADRRDGTGSAVVVAADGLMATSAHVVAGAHGGEASFADGRVVPFDVVGRDPLSDLAVIRAESLGDAPLEPATLGDAEELEIGHLVIAVGSPLGFAGSVSAGIVSGLGRSLPAREGDHLRIIENVIQTDAALHPGNSGGALANARGDVIGINTAVVGPGWGQGLGLAVPINAVTESILGELIVHGRFRRAYLGLAGGERPLPPRSARATGRAHGFEVTTVMRDSAAARAGVRVEDIIVEVDGVAVSDAGDLQREMSGQRIGEAVEVGVVRGDTVTTLTVVPDELVASN